MRYIKIDILYAYVGAYSHAYKQIIPYIKTKIVSILKSIWSDTKMQKKNKNWETEIDLVKIRVHALKHACNTTCFKTCRKTYIQ